MLVVSTKKFVEKQSMYLDMAKNGEEIVLKSRECGSFKIIPVTEDNTLINKEYILEPNIDLERAITADELLARLVPRIERLFDK